MKKMMALLIIFVIILIGGYSFASLNTNRLEFKVINNSEKENFDLYLLLPKNYIEFAIKNSNLNIEYNGANTLKENTILGISVKKEDVQEDVQIQDGIEYVQILLDGNLNNVFKFDILEDYPNLDIKYRITNDKKDYIVHIDNFKFENGICKITYDYDKDIVKQPDKIMTNTAVILLIILFIVIIVGTISYIKQRR